MKIRSLFALCVLFTLTVIQGFAGDTVSQPRLGYSATLPDGWKQIPPDVIKEYMRLISAAAGSQAAQQYDDGFQRASDDGWFQYPYLLVQVKDGGRVPEGQLAQMKTLHEGIKDGMDVAAQKMQGIISGMSVGDTYYDATNKCLLVRMSMNVTQVGEVRALTCGFLTEKGIIFFYCYAKASDFDNQLETFQSILKSVRITDDLRYKSRISDKIGFDFARVGRSALIGGLIGGAVGVVLWLKKKLQTQKVSPVEPPPLP